MFGSIDYSVETAANLFEFEGVRNLQSGVILSHPLAPICLLQRSCNSVLMYFIQKRIGTMIDKSDHMRTM